MAAVPNHNWVKRNPVTAYMVLAFGLFWAGFIPYAASITGLLHSKIPDEVPMFAQYGPSIAALIVVGLQKGQSGIRDLLRRVIHWRVGVQWYAVALLLTPIIMTMVLIVNAIFGRAPDIAKIGGWDVRFHQEIAGLTSMGLLSWLAKFMARGRWQTATMYFIFAICNGGVSEELGWRGYLLPTLQKQRTALTASVGVGLTWALWHFDWPSLFMKKIEITFSQLLVYAILCTAQAILLTWIYNNTEGGLLLPILFHASYNATITFVNLSWGAPGQHLPIVRETIVGLCLVAVVVVAIFGPDRLVLRRGPTASPSLA